MPEGSQSVVAEAMQARGSHADGDAAARANFPTLPALGAAEQLAQVLVHLGTAMTRGLVAGRQGLRVEERRQLVIGLCEAAWRLNSHSICNASRPRAGMKDGSISVPWASLSALAINSALAVNLAMITCN